MKKRILGIALIGTMLFTMPVFGAEVDGTDPKALDKDNDSGKYSVTYTKTEDGKEYMIWVVKDNHDTVDTVSFSQNNVLYVNQETGTANGVTFDGFLPMKSMDSTVLISGQGMQDPVIVGYIKGEGNTISGNIGLGGRTSGKLEGVTVTLTSTTDATVVYTATTAADGTFTLEGVEDGTYKMVVTRGSYLSYTDKTFEVNSETTWSESITLLAGDLNGDGWVLAQDFMQLKKSLSKYGNNLPEDLNGDGWVLAQDFMMLKANLSRNATTKS